MNNIEEMAVQVKFLKQANKGWMRVCNRLLKKYCADVKKIQMLETECKALREQVNELQRVL